MAKAASSAGYSGTPLAKKLGIKESSHVLTVGSPDDYASWLHPLPDDVTFETRVNSDVDVAHVFVTEQKDLVKHLTSLRKKLQPDAAIWVSWPKKASKVPTTVTEDSIREAAFPLGLVDIKVCAVTDVWSGLILLGKSQFT
jgi:hypothetical protein